MQNCKLSKIKVTKLFCTIEELFVISLICGHVEHFPLDIIGCGNTGGCVLE